MQASVFPWQGRLGSYARLMRLDKPIGIYLLLWPTVWGLVAAGNGRPDLSLTIVFILGVFLMRSAGCVVNDLVDRDIDPKVTRTKERPIANADVSPGEALWLFLGILAFTAPLLLFLNWPTRWLSLGAVFLAVTYPFTKRVTHLPQVYLGAAFGWAIPMAFMAHQRALPLETWWLYLVTVLWAVIYDTMYAMVDREDDLQAGVKSSAILFGAYDRIVIGGLQLIVCLLLYGLANYLNLHPAFYLFLLLGAGNFLYQQYLIKDRLPKQCFKAFLVSHWFGLVIVIGLLLGYQMS